MILNFQIEGGSSKDYKIPIRAKIIGSIDLVVEATGIDENGNSKTDVIKKPLLVKVRQFNVFYFVL